MYKERKVYVSFCGNLKVHTCEGAARDRAYYGDRNVEESRLLYTGCIDDLGCVYSAYEFGGNSITSWFGSRKEVQEALARMGYKGNPVIEEAFLDTDTIAPITFPMRVVFEEGKDGRPFARLNLHPEVNGTHGRSKICFPDKSLIGADAGEAVITGVKEFDRYGFLTGEMVKNRMPEDMADFLDWAWRNMVPDTTILTIDHPGRGRYLATQAGDYIKPCGKGHYEVMLSMYSGEDRHNYCVAQNKLADLFIADVFPGETSDTPYAKFAKSVFILQCSRFQGTRWQYTDKYYSDLVDSAIREGAIRQVTLSGTPIVAFEVVYDRIYRLTAFTPEELDELVATVSSVNKKADEDIAARMRNGKLRIAYLGGKLYGKNK